MKREDLEKYLGKKVTITLYDGDEMTGELHKTGEGNFKHNADLCYPTKHYFVTNDNKNVGCLFRSSHVIKFKEK